MDYQLVDDVANKRYVFELGDVYPRIEYIKTPTRIVLTHTEVPPEHEGKGIASALVRAVLEAVDRSGLTLVPLCPFVAMYIKKHPEWKRLVLKGINIE
ncbi:MAG: GNAT family N-acetyltransferase [Bacteroidota bacterium]